MTTPTAPEAADRRTDRRSTCASAKAAGEKMKVLEDINLTVQENDVMALLGPSGCGKSTIMRISPASSAEQRHRQVQGQAAAPA